MAQGVTQARIGLSRIGCSLSTTNVLKFNLDHALARDAVHAPWNYETVFEFCEQNHIETKLIHTRTSNRQDYLLNPNLGAFVHDDEANILKNEKQSFNISLILTDGLSAHAIDQHFYHFLLKFIPQLKTQFPKFTVSPIIIAPFGRVALSDHIGELYQSMFSIIFVGERPGLSAIDSMGIYFTPAPKIGRTNADRKCISNIRPPFGLSYERAINELIKLIQSRENEFRTYLSSF